MKLNHLSDRKSSFLSHAVVAGCFALVTSVASAASDPLAATLLHDFDNGNEGFNPNAGLLLDNGQFYGATTLAGDGGNPGTIFRISPTGTFASLHGFTSAEGGGPVSTLVRGADGNFYGSTTIGGAANQGTIYRVTPAGALTTLYSFSGPDGAIPVGALVLASDGNFYGTTLRGGATGSGTAFRISPAGALTTIHSFVTTDGVLPSGALIQGPDGNFYGTTEGAGPDPNNDAGTVFRLTPAGALTVIHTFDGITGARPFAGLFLASDGSFYGTTQTGGANNVGVAFRLNSVGVYTVLHSFNTTDGAGPRAVFIQGVDAAFYGTTEFGGANGNGVAFKVTSGGVFTLLYNFVRPVGDRPLSEVTIGPDGGLYGTTVGGGRESGSVYRLLPKYTFKIAAEDGVPFNVLEHPYATLRGKTLTDIKVCLTNPSSAPVTVPFTVTPSNQSPLEYAIITPADQTLVFQPGVTEQVISIRTKFPSSYLQCNNTYTFVLGPASNAAPGDITTNVLTVRNNGALGFLCN